MVCIRDAEMKIVLQSELEKQAIMIKEEPTNSEAVFMAILHEF